MGNFCEFSYKVLFQKDNQSNEHYISILDGQHHLIMSKMAVKGFTKFLLALGFTWKKIHISEKTDHHQFSFWQIQIN
jgi:hypothetical protein